MSKIYVASSWRNPYQPSVVQALRLAGHEVYDFRRPKSGSRGFHWSGIDPDWQAWGPSQFIDALKHPLAQEGFATDFDAMQWADEFVLVQPCGKSAHLELGWAAGANKETFILLDDGEPELMFLLADHLCTSIDELINLLGGQ